MKMAVGDNVSETARHLCFWTGVLVFWGSEI